METKFKKKQKFGYFFDSNFELLTKKECFKVVEEEVLQNMTFKKHLRQVSMNLDIDIKVVESIITFYCYNVSLACNTVKKYTRELNIIGFIKVLIKPGNRV